MLKKLLALLACFASVASAQVMYEKTTVSPRQHVSCTNGSTGARDVVLLSAAAAVGGSIVLEGNCTINATITLISNTKFDGNGYTVTAAAAANWSGSTITHALAAASNATQITVQNTNFVWTGASGSVHILQFPSGNSQIAILNNTSTGAGDLSANIGSTDVSVIGNKCYMSSNACFDNWNGSGYLKIIGNTASLTTAATNGYGILVTGFNTNNSAGTALSYFTIADNNVLLNGQAVGGQVGIYVQGYASSYAGLNEQDGTVHDNTCTVAAGIWGECIRGTGYINNINIHDNIIWSDGLTTSTLPAIEIGATGPTNVWVHHNHANNWVGQTAGSDRGVFTNKATGGSLEFNTCTGTCSSPTDYVASSTTIQQAGDDTGTGTIAFNSPVTFASGATGDLYAGATSDIGWTGRGILTSPGANQIRIGSANSATPSGQEIFTQGSRSGTDTNVGGGSLTIHAGQGTGTGTASTIVLDTPVIGSTGTTLQTLVSGMQLGSTQIFYGNATSNPTFTFRGSGAISGTPVTSLFAAPPAIGGTTPAAGAFTTLTSSSGMPLSSLATQATNTVAGNATSGSAVPTALAVGTCSTSASALNWTTNTGFGCNTSINAGTLGGATFAAPGAIGSGTPSTGAFTTLTGQSGHSAVITLCEYAAAAGTTHTGGTSEFNLAVCTIPANSMGSQGSLRITAHWLRTATTTNTVTLTIRMAAVSGSTSAGITPLASGQATSGVVAIGTTTYVRNTATGAQLMTYSGTGAGVGTATSAPTTGAQDTTATQYINFNCADTTNSADTCGIYAYMVELIIP